MAAVTDWPQQQTPQLSDEDMIETVSKAGPYTPKGTKQKILTDYGFVCTTGQHVLCSKSPDADSRLASVGSGGDPCSTKCYPDVPAKISTMDSFMAFEYLLRSCGTLNSLIPGTEKNRYGHKLGQELYDVGKELSSEMDSMRELHDKLEQKLQAIVPRLNKIATTLAGREWWTQALDLTKLQPAALLTIINTMATKGFKGQLDSHEYMCYLKGILREPEDGSKESRDEAIMMRDGGSGQEWLDDAIHMWMPLCQTPQSLEMLLFLSVDVLHGKLGDMFGPEYLLREVDARILLIMRICAGCIGFDNCWAWVASVDVAASFRRLEAVWRLRVCSPALIDPCFHDIHAEMLCMLQSRARYRICHRVHFLSHEKGLPVELADMICQYALAVEGIPAEDIAVSAERSIAPVMPVYGSRSWRRPLMKTKIKLRKQWSCKHMVDYTATKILPAPTLPDWMDDAAILWYKCR